MGDSTSKLLRYSEAEFTERVDSSGFGPRTRKLYEHLNGRVIGQDRGAKRLAQSTSIYYAGLKDPTKPIGAYVFAGPTGQGKTLMAEELARFLISDEPRAPLTRIPCARFSERHRVSELIGSPAGYVDSDKVPKLAQIKIDEHHFWVKVRPILEKGLPDAMKKRDMDEVMAELYEQHKPYLSVLLFDEAEKAHEEIRNSLLHVIDDGELAMAQDQTTLFHNSVIILTCNIGGREQQQLLSGKTGKIGFGSGDLSAQDEDELDQRIYEQTRDLIEKQFPPELVGRVEIIVFRALNRDQAMVVLDGLLRKEQDKLTGKSSNSVPVILMFSDGFRDFVLEKGYSRTRGMRELKRAVKKYVTLPLANALESGDVRKGDEVMFRMENGSPALYRKPRPVLLGPAKPRDPKP